MTVTDQESFEEEEAITEIPRTVRYSDIPTSPSPPYLTLDLHDLKMFEIDGVITEIHPSVTLWEDGYR
jgi:hypothetical protein